jgi:hypothetical protein
MSISLAYMIILFSTSIIDLSSGKISFNEIPRYMMDFLVKFIISVIVMMIGLILLAEREIRVVIVREEK